MRECDVGLQDAIAVIHLSPSVKTCWCRTPESVVGVIGTVSAPILDARNLLCADRTIFFDIVPNLYKFTAGLSEEASR